MKRNVIFIFIHFWITLIILCGAEFLFGKFVLHKVMTRQNTLIWSSYILGAITIVTLGIIVNSFLNRFFTVSPTVLLFINIIAALVSSVFYIILCNNQGRGLLDYVDYSRETDYFVMVILSVFVLGCSILEGTIWRIIYRIIMKK